MTIVEVARPVTGGVDTHLDVHVAAALDHIGGLLGVESFPTTPAGYRSLADWMSGFGPLHRVGVEGTGAYGAGLARYLRQLWGRGDRGRPGQSSSPSRARQVRSRRRGGSGQSGAVRVAACGCGQESRTATWKRSGR